MKVRNLSIRAALFGIIGFLNFLLAIIAVSNTVQSVETLNQADSFREASSVMNTLFSYASELSLERGTAVAAVYAKPENISAAVQETSRLDAEADAIFAKVLPGLKQRADLQIFLKDYDKKQKALKEILARLYSAKEVSRDARLADNMLFAFNDLVASTDELGLRAGGNALAENPAGARRVGFARLVWFVSEFSGRQIAILGRLIAEGKYPTEEQERDLLTLQGKIEYGWQLAYGYLETSTGGAAQRPLLDEAKSQFDVTFEQAKSIFIPPDKRTAASYPISSEMWLDMAAQTQDSLQKLTTKTIESNRSYIEEMRTNALRDIPINIFLLISTLGLSIYSWLLIDRRVLHPIRLMIDSMYRAARGDHYELPSTTYGADEIGKLGDTLRIFRANAQQLEVERDRANSANVAKSEFLASMSHEIRTPMNVVLNITNLLQSEKTLSDQQKKLLGMQERNGQMLMALLNDLLDVSKIETGSFELECIPFRLDQAINEVIALLSTKALEKGIVLNGLTSAVQERQYVGDPTRVKQILTNLCGNAIKFTTHGAVTVAVSVKAGPSRSEEVVSIKVIDTGIGIPQEKFERIFDKFTQADSSVSRRYGGTGLGLAIAKTFIEMMGGSISVQSEVAKGSTFLVTLPLKKAENAAQPEQADDLQAEAERGSFKKILLVEDYAPNAFIAGTFLEQFGFRHEVAEDGPRALEIVKRDHFDIVLMDIQMPGMDGFEVTRQIRSLEKALNRGRARIIGLTAHATFQDRDKCFAAGMDDFLAKPFSPKELREKLTEQ